MTGTRMTSTLLHILDRHAQQWLAHPYSLHGLTDAPMSQGILSVPAYKLEPNAQSVHQVRVVHNRLLP
jgi:hypothetical protein